MSILDKLCADLLSVIPESRGDVRALISSIKGRLVFSAPELDGLHWNELIATLNAIDETEPYHAEVVRLFGAASAEKTAETTESGERRVSMTEPVQHVWVETGVNYSESYGGTFKMLRCELCGEEKMGDKCPPGTQGVMGVYKVWNKRETCYTPEELATRKAHNDQFYAELAEKNRREEARLRNGPEYVAARAALASLANISGAVVKLAWQDDPVDVAWARELVDE